MLLLCLLTHLPRSNIGSRRIGVSVAAPLHKGLPWCMQELAVLSLLLLMRVLNNSCKGAHGQGGYLPHESSSEVFVSQVERSGKAGETDQKEEEEEEEKKEKEEGSRAMSCLIPSQQGLGPAVGVLCVLERTLFQNLE